MSSSRNRLIAVPALVVLALVGVSACASSSGGSSKAGAAVGASSPARSVTAKPSPPPAKPTASGARSWVPNNPAYADVCRSKLPNEARDTLGLIDKGGPYPYRNDGIVFENRENRLPKQAGGYYHEYTVVTPGSSDRGTRRVVTGSVGEEYWTGDHYATFQAIDSRC